MIKLLPQHFDMASAIDPRFQVDLAGSALVLGLAVDIETLDPLEGPPPELGEYDTLLRAFCWRLARIRCWKTTWGAMRSTRRETCDIVTRSL